MDCSIPGCAKPARTRGWCSAHYQRWWAHGDPLSGRRPERPRGLTEAEAFAWFMPGDPPAEGCWDWTAGTSRGYGQFNMNRKPVLAHVVSYRIYCGDTEDLCVLHWCDRPICVQPLHLHLGDRDLNNREARERGLTTIGSRGEQNPAAKLTEAEVLWVKRQAGMTQAQMAERLGVSGSTISDILHERTWAFVI
ncbi:MAG: helix-turn-helix domain-containing protein [Nitrosomonas sp.]|nr:MAG: helix-turn-helix domain-containing protein [Nitrosomonas sp.]